MCYSRPSLDIDIDMIIRYQTDTIYPGGGVTTVDQQSDRFYTALPTRSEQYRAAVPMP